MELVIALCSGFVLAALAPTLYRWMGERVAYLVALLPLGLTIYFGQQLVSLEAGQVQTVQYAWVGALDLSLSLYLDGLSLLFVLIITGVGTLVAIYSRGYLAGYAQVGLFHAYMLSFMASMIGIVLSGNVLTLYVFWELTTITSYLLIGFDHEQDSARRAALQALVTTTVGGLAMLAGMVLLGMVGESFEFAELLTQGDAVRQHPLYPAILILIFIGAFTKSAQFPFHFWLPNAMEAPTPVSAYLHSATMVKAGIYLLARLLPILGETDQWSHTLMIVGAATMFIGAYLAYYQHALKAVLAYLTIKVLGTLVMLLGIGTELAIKAALAYMFAHTLYKGALFMLAGAIGHQAHTLDIRQLGGLWRPMPVTFVTGIFAALSMAGILPMFGFVAKELYLEAAWKAPSYELILTAISVVASIFLVAGAGIVALIPFFGTAPQDKQEVREANVRFLLSPVLLAAAGLAVGFFPQQLATPLIEPALASVLQESVSVELSLWHGVTAPFVLSMVAVVLGAILFAVRKPLLKRVAETAWITRWGPEAWYHRIIAAVQWLAKQQTRLLQGGHLRTYVLTILITTVALVGTLLSYVGPGHLWQASNGIRWYEGLTATVILVAAWVAVRSYERYRAVVSLGVIGFSMSWLFVRFGAPDLAMTQIVVDALTVLLFVLAFRGLPNLKNVSSTGVRLRDAALALSVGAMTTLLLLMVTAYPGRDPISEYFAEQSYLAAHGRNVVNVILVDFRALDTLGEVTVLSTAAIGSYALIRLVLSKGSGA